MSCNQLSTKKPSENVIVTFDYSDALSTGETITSIVSVVASISAGVDASPSAILNGSATIDSANVLVLQPVTGGLDNVNYDITALVNTSQGQRLACAAILPVRA